jgi:hypothetical protein
MAAGTHLDAFGLISSFCYIPTNYQTSVNQLLAGAKQQMTDHKSPIAMLSFVKAWSPADHGCYFWHSVLVVTRIGRFLVDSAVAQWRRLLKGVIKSFAWLVFVAILHSTFRDSIWTDCSGVDDFIDLREIAAIPFFRRLTVDNYPEPIQKVQNITFLHFFVVWGFVTRKEAELTRESSQKKLYRHSHIIIQPLRFM